MEMLQGYQDRLVHSTAWEEIQMVWMEFDYLNINQYLNYVCGPGTDEHPNLLWFHPNDGSS